MKLIPVIFLILLASCSSGRTATTTSSYTARDSLLVEKTASARTTLDLREALAVDACISLDSVEIILPSRTVVRAREATVESRTLRRTDITRTAERADSLVALSSTRSDGHSEVRSARNAPFPRALLVCACALFGLFCLTLYFKSSAR